MLCLLILCIEAAGAVSLTCLSESEVHLKTPTLEPSVSLCLLMLECKMNAKKKKKIAFNTEGCRRKRHSADHLSATLTRIPLMQPYTHLLNFNL